jgi:tripeptidyl-peptidase-1
MLRLRRLLILFTLTCSKDSIRIVRSWLVDNGIKNDSITHTDNQAWLAFWTTATQIKSLLQAEYFEYQHQQTGDITSAYEQYHVPQHIQQHLDYTAPGTKLMAPSKRPIKHEKRGVAARSEPAGLAIVGETKPLDQLPSQFDGKHNMSICDQAVTPACIAALYNVPPGGRADPSNSMGILGSLWQNWSQHDLDSFFTRLTSIPEGTHPIEKTVELHAGPDRDTTPFLDQETTLDLMSAYPIGKDTPLRVDRTTANAFSLSPNHHSLECGRLGTQ